MSRIGRMPIPVPTGVDVAIDGQRITVTGPKGTLSHAVPSLDSDGAGDGVRQRALGSGDRDALPVDGDVDAGGHGDGHSADSRHGEPPTRRRRGLPRLLHAWTPAGR